MASGIVSENQWESSLPSTLNSIVQLVSEIVFRYDISALVPFLRVCQSTVTRQDLRIAVLGRFKAGKSSFLNHFVRRHLLPVGVIPVTSVVTEVLWGPEEAAEVRFLDGRTERVPIAAIGSFVTEAENPENQKQVSGVCLYVPELEAYQGLCFVDTPGLESAFVHNTEASLAWVPNVDLALVAVGVDPPLSQQDVLLIRKLFEYTSKICVLLTKVDVLTEAETSEVLRFVKEQLNRNFPQPIEVFPYSTKHGFESLRATLERQLIHPTLKTRCEQKREIVFHKLQTLVRECSEYLQLMLRSAELVDQERQQLRSHVLEDREALTDTTLELQLVAQHNIGTTRAQIEKILAPYEHRVGAELVKALEQEYPAWRMRFSPLLEHFEGWLRRLLIVQLAAISAAHRTDFLKPVRDVQRQYVRVLQAFRDRLSERTMELFGVPLRTTETEIEPASPKMPDVQIGRLFDHNWELLSPLLPMTLLRHPVKQRFLRKVNRETFKNLSRLTTQWQEIVAASVQEMQREAEHRLQDLVETVGRLTASPAVQIAEIQSDLDRLRKVFAFMHSR